jgi:hypothetical protein
MSVERRTEEPATVKHGFVWAVCLLAVVVLSPLLTAMLIGIFR